MAKILLVEDQDDIRTVLTLALKGRGHEVEAHADGESALKALESWWPDVAIVDSSLPGMSGLQFGRAIVERTGSRNRIPMALFTGTDPAELYRQSQEEGFDLFVPKPISISHFCEAIDQLSRESV